MTMGPEPITKTVFGGAGDICAGVVTSATLLESDHQTGDEPQRHRGHRGHREGNKRKTNNLLSVFSALSASLRFIPGFAFR
jgi:hypothetical protein